MENELFQSMYAGYKNRVDDNVFLQAKELDVTAKNEYGDFVSLPLEAGLSVLTAKAKRIRGILTIVGYEMMGGEDPLVANSASVAMEMLHADLAIIDDIQDQSNTRRGVKPAHKFVQEEIDGCSEQSTGSLAEYVTINGALQLGHFALSILGKIPGVGAEEKINAINATNDALFKTGFGQTGDMLAPFIGAISDGEINRASGDKTKYYTFRAPLEVGMYLAGAEDEDVARIIPFADKMGEIYQLKNDLEVTNTSVDGVDRADDIKSGKRTLILQFALSGDSKLSGGLKTHLRQNIGRPDLSPTECMRIQKRLAKSGAVEFVDRIINFKKEVALDSLGGVGTKGWGKDQKEFLHKIGEMVAS